MINEEEKKVIARETIGCMLRSEKSIYKCLELGLNEDCFSEEDPRLKSLYKTILSEFKDHNTLPVKESLVRELGKGDKEESHVYRGLINKCINLAQNPALIEKYIYQLEDYRETRELTTRIKETAEKARNNDFNSVDDMVGFLNDKLLGLQGRSKSKRVVSSFDSCNNTIFNLRNNHAQPVTTGFDELDAPLYGGFFPGGLVTIAGRPGQGKTTVMLQLATNAAKQGHGSLFLSAELPVQDINYRQLSLVSSIPYSKMFRGFSSSNKDGFLTEADMKELSEVTEIYKKFPLKLGNVSGLDIDTICNLIIEQVRLYDIKIVFIDYFQLLNMKDRSGAPRRPNSANEFSEVCGKLRHLAIVLQVPIVMGAQLNRECEKRKGAEKKPRLSDLKQTGSIEEDSYLVLGLYRDEYYTKEKSTKPGELDIEILKNRNGKCMNTTFAFLGKKGAIRSIPKSAEKPQEVKDGKLVDSTNSTTSKEKSNAKQKV